jgi:hypothetical protein
MPSCDCFFIKDFARHQQPQAPHHHKQYLDFFGTTAESAFFNF